MIFMHMPTTGSRIHHSLFVPGPVCFLERISQYDPGQFLSCVVRQYFKARSVFYC